MKPNEPKPIAFVCMPFASVKRPALGVSLLQAELKRKNIGSDIIYLNLLFAKRTGIKNYTRISEHSPTTALEGEWIFSGALCGDSPENDSTYLNEILSAKHSRHFSRNRIIETFRLKQNAPGFIRECLHLIDWSKYKIIGFTSSYQQNCSSLALARAIKEKYPQCIIVFGGANCESEMGLSLLGNFPFIDYVCSGEGEISFTNLAGLILAGKTVPDINGIIQRKNGKPAVPPKMVSSPVAVDELPFPEYDDYFTQLRQQELDKEIQPVIPFETSRGCWWGQIHHCSFCGLNGLSMHFRSKNGERALNELLYLKENYGDKFQVVDNILDNNYFKTFLPRLAELKTGTGLFYEVKTNLKKEQIRLLAASGVTHLQPGIESFSDHVLRLMQKGTNSLQNIQTMKWCREYGIRLSWNLLCGIPGEHRAEYERMAELIPLITHLDPPGSCSLVRVDRFSPYFTNPEAHAITRIEPIEAYSCIYHGKEYDIAGLAYYFRFEHDFISPPAEHLAMITEPVSEWQKNAFSTHLHITPNKEGAIISDSRNCSTNPEWKLNGIESAIYLFCDKIQSLKAISDFAESISGDTPTDILHILDTFCQNRLMIRSSEKYLSLAILQPAAGISSV